MTDRRRHEHQPDQAALDELMRAFSDDRPAAAEAPTSETPPTQPVTAPGADAGDGTNDATDDRAGAATGVDDADAIDEVDDADAVDEVDDADAVDEGDADAIGVSGPGASDPAIDLGPDHGADLDPDPDVDPDADLDVDPGADLDADLDVDPGDAAIDALLIVEQAPPVAAPGPPVIRIDDLDRSGAVPAMSPPHRGWRSWLRRRGAATGPGTFGDGDGGSFDPRDLDDEIAASPGRPTRVVIGADDDLPDPVYVEGSLDAGGSRTVVIIEDDDTGDTLAPESERDVRRGIEPRMRERRVAVKRAQGRRRLKRVAIVAVVLLLLVGALALVGSPLFSIERDQVVVTGNVYTDAARLEEIIDDLVGTPALRVDSQGIEEDIEAIPWVDEAKVRVQFPHAATIEIRERAAMTTYQGPDGRFRVLDRDGRVLDVIENYAFAYVLLGGPDPVDLEPGEFAPRGYAAASELAKNLTGSVRGRVTMIEVTADGSRLVVHLDDGSPVFFGEATELFVKLVRLEAVLSSGEPREPGPIDVSTDDVTL